jgi:hypothetical protein
MPSIGKKLLVVFMIWKSFASIKDLVWVRMHIFVKPGELVINDH